MNVLLINPMASRKPPIKGRGVHFPVGLGLIASSLKAEGHNVTVLDNETECLNKYDLFDYIKGSGHDIFGISAMATQYSYVKKLSRMIKELTGKTVVLGGPLATYSYETVLGNTDIDICVIGAGEETAIDLFENLGDLSKVPGIAFKHDGQIETSSARALARSRDDYPFPAYELFNMQSYTGKQQIQYEGWGAKYLNKDVTNIKNMGISTGIGCPYHCKFCSRSVIKPRLRSIDNIIAEIRYCIDNFGIKGVRFLDDLLIINEKRTLELCEKIKPLNIVWSGQARTNTLNDRLAKAMKDAGCVGVGFGLESGSDRMLKAMKKQVTVADHKNAVMTAKKNGLSIRVQILFGYPGENRESAEETITFFKDIQIPPRRFNVLTPLPGSELYDECLRDGIITDQDEYLEKVAAQDAGFGSKKVLLNLTEMSDDEFVDLMMYTENTMEENYKKIFKTSNSFWFLLVLREYLQRQLHRVKKIVSIPAWKKKFNLKFNSPEGKLTRSQIEELYFRL